MYICVNNLLVTSNILAGFVYKLKNNMLDTTTQFKNFVNRYLLEALNLFAILETENYVQYYETD
jgi:hypothetical protein